MEFLAIVVEDNRLAKADLFRLLIEYRDRFNEGQLPCLLRSDFGNVFTQPLSFDDARAREDARLAAMNSPLSSTTPTARSLQLGCLQRRCAISVRRREIEIDARDALRSIARLCRAAQSLRERCFET